MTTGSYWAAPTVSRTEHIVRRENGKQIGAHLPNVCAPLEGVRQGPYDTGFGLGPPILIGTMSNTESCRQKRGFCSWLQYLSWCSSL
jgi:hypothetical protein